MRIAQQALTNACQHSNAIRIKIELHFGSREFLLRVADDGSGFKPAEVRRGFGLRSMRERARLLGGKLRVESGPGKGTMVEARIPLSRTHRGTT
jgi:signal transduction histidine kinase